MNFLYVQMSQEILLLAAQDGGRMILLTQQVKKSTLTSSASCKQIIDKPTHVVITICHALTFYFVPTKTLFSNYGVDVSIFDKCPLDINFGKINIHALQYMSVKSGITIRQS